MIESIRRLKSPLEAFRHKTRKRVAQAVGAADFLAAALSGDFNRRML
jgi:hypothetical protein